MEIANLKFNSNISHPKNFNNSIFCTSCNILFLSILWNFLTLIYEALWFHDFQFLCYCSCYSFQLQFFVTNNYNKSIMWNICKRIDGNRGDQGRKASTQNYSNRTRTKSQVKPPLNLAQLQSLKVAATETSKRE